MKCLSPILVLLALGAHGALAQSPPPGPPIEKLAAELQLDEYQRGEVKRILEEHREQMRKHMEQARAELLQQLQSVLTAEQIEKFNKLQEERRARMRDAPPPPF